MKKILIAGDSFGFGQGCSDRLFYIDKDTREYVGDQNLVFKGPSQHCWATLLQNDYPQYEVVNVSYPGLDNVSISMNIFQRLNEDFELVIFAGTAANRLQISDPKYPNITMPWIIGSIPIDKTYPEEWINATKYYTKHLYNEKAVASLSTNAVSAIYGLSVLNNNKFLYSLQNVIQPERTAQWLAKLDKYNMLDMYNFILGPVTGNIRYIAEDGHANDLGHLEYYKQIVKPALERIEL